MYTFEIIFVIETTAICNIIANYYQYTLLQILSTTYYISLASLVVATMIKESGNLEAGLNVQIALQAMIKFLIYTSLNLFIFTLVTIYLSSYNIFILLISQPYILSYFYLLLYKIKLKAILLRIFQEPLDAQQQARFN